MEAGAGGGDVGVAEAVGEVGVAGEVDEMGEGVFGAGAMTGVVGEAVDEGGGELRAMLFYELMPEGEGEGVAGAEAVFLDATVDFSSVIELPRDGLEGGEEIDRLPVAKLGGGEAVEVVLWQAVDFPRDVLGQAVADEAIARVGIEVEGGDEGGFGPFVGVGVHEVAAVPFFFEAAPGLIIAGGGDGEVEDVFLLRLGFEEDGPALRLEAEDGVDGAAGADKGGVDAAGQGFIPRLMKDGAVGVAGFVQVGGGAHLDGLGLGAIEGGGDFQY